VAVLTDEATVSIIVYWNDHGAASVDDDFAVVFDFAVANAVEADVEDAAFIDNFGMGYLWRHWKPENLLFDLFGSYCVRPICPNR
jgi:hypothetical protein